MITKHKYSEELKEVMRMMRPPGKTLNETQSYGMASSFPHYKHILMPPDQRAKLLEMHRSSKATAGIYVAVVLSVYFILLTLLLCRYAKRRPSSTDAASLLTAPPGIPPPQPQPSGVSCGSCHFICHLTPNRIKTIYENICCCRDTHSMQESIQDHEYPMTPLTSQIEFKEKRKGNMKPVNV